MLVSQKVVIKNTNSIRNPHYHTLFYNPLISSSQKCLTKQSLILPLFRPTHIIRYLGSVWRNCWIRKHSVGLKRRFARLISSEWRAASCCAEVPPPPGHHHSRDREREIHSKQTLTESLFLTSFKWYTFDFSFPNLVTLAATGKLRKLISWIFKETKVTTFVKLKKSNKSSSKDYIRCLCVRKRLNFKSYSTKTIVQKQYSLRNCWSILQLIKRNLWKLVSATK